MRLTPADVHNVAFSKPPIGKRGYNEDEVDQFLDEIVKELEHMEQENKLLELRNQMLLDRMARDGVSLSEEDKK